MKQIAISVKIEHVIFCFVLKDGIVYVPYIGNLITKMCELNV